MIAAPMTPARSPSAARDDAQVARRERERALEDDLAQAGEELLVDLAEVAADARSRAGLKKFTHAASTSPSVAAGLADHADRVAGCRARTSRTTSRLSAAS